MQSTALISGQVIALVIDDQVDNCSLRQRRRLIQHKPSILYSRLQTAHTTTIHTLPTAAGQASRRVRIRLPKSSTRAASVGKTTVVEPGSSTMAGPFSASPDPRRARS